MENKIDLKAILAKHSPAIDRTIKYGIEINYPVDLNRLFINGGDALLAMEETWILAVNQCKEKVEDAANSYGDPTLSLLLLIDSIEDIKQLIK